MFRYSFTVCGRVIARPAPVPGNAFVRQRRAPRRGTLCTYRSRPPLARNGNKRRRRARRSAGPAGRYDISSADAARDPNDLTSCTEARHGNRSGVSNVFGNVRNDWSRNASAASKRPARRAEKANFTTGPKSGFLDTPRVRSYRNSGVYFRRSAFPPSPCLLT